MKDPFAQVKARERLDVLLVTQQAHGSLSMQANQCSDLSGMAMERSALSRPKAQMPQIIEGINIHAIFIAPRLLDHGGKPLLLPGWFNWQHSLFSMQKF